MKKWQNVALTLLLVQFVFSVKTFAYSPKKGNITSTLGPYIYKTNFSDTVGTGANSPILGDFAFNVNGDVNEHGSLEVAVFHMHKYFYRSQGGNSIVQGTELIQIDMGYRKWLNSKYSVAWGFYSTYSLGTSNIVHNDYPAGSAPNTSAAETTLYGLDLSLQSEVWSHDRFSVIVNGIYSIPFTVKQDEKADLFGVFVGLRYFVQEQQLRDRKKDELKVHP